MQKAETIRKAMVMGALLTPLLSASNALAGDPDGIKVQLPSGALVYWQETLHDSAGGLGLTARFRFVMPDLATRVPSTSGPASDFAASDFAEDARGPIDIDTESGEVEGAEIGGAEIEGTDAAQPDAAMAETVAPPGAEMPDDGSEQAADALVEEPVLPAAPDILAQDPIHQDIVWLCENWALPRIASPAPRPRQIIISLADKKTPFGAYDPDVVQLFEAFRLPPDRAACEWEPW